jgi:hypothetical protein
MERRAPRERGRMGTSVNTNAPKTRTTASVTFRNTHDKLLAISVVSEVRRETMDPEEFSSKKAIGCARTTSNSVARNLRTTRFCANANRKTFQKSSAAFTPPAIAKSSNATRSAFASASMHAPIAREMKCGAASEKGKRARSDARPNASHPASSRASARSRANDGGGFGLFAAGAVSLPRSESSSSSSSSSCLRACRVTDGGSHRDRSDHHR